MYLYGSAACFRATERTAALPCNRQAHPVMSRGSRIMKVLQLWSKIKTCSEVKWYSNEAYAIRLQICILSIKVNLKNYCVNARCASPQNIPPRRRSVIGIYFGGGIEAERCCRQLLSKGLSEG